MRTRELRAYMAHGGDSQDGAILVFHFSAREARKLAAPTVMDWTDCSFTAVRVGWLRSGCPHLRQQDLPHIVEDPPSCSSCELWWEEPLVDGLCTGCREGHDPESEECL